jgi:hypothetical protein
LKVGCLLALCLAALVNIVSGSEFLSIGNRSFQKPGVVLIERAVLFGPDLNPKEQFL